MLDAPPLAACSHDEYSPLLEVVVGTAAGARLPDLDRSAWLNLYPELTAAEVAAIPTGAFPPRLLEEAQADLDGLADILTGLGVTVHRPAPIDHGAEFATPHWRTGGFYSYCPRDLALVVGSTIIATPSPVRARRHELDALRELFAQRMEGGSAWIAAPAPQLRDALYPLDARGRPTLGEDEPAFDAANVLRAGRDLYYLVSGSGNEAGLRWLQTTLSALGDYRVHPIRGVYPHTHIDSTIALIRPGLALLNPARIPDPDVLPEPLRSWEHLWCPPMAPAVPPAAPPGRPVLSSHWIGMNLLMIRPDLAIVDAAQHQLAALLRRHGVEVVGHTLRHARALGGGFHCVTLDLRRDRAPAAAAPGAVAGPPTRERIAGGRDEVASPDARRGPAARVGSDLPQVVAHVADAYDLGTPVSWTVLTTGFQDCNVDLATPRGRYVVKVFATGRPPGIAHRTARLIEAARAGGVRHPRLHRGRDGALVHHHRPGSGGSAHQVLVMDFVAGRSLYQLRRHPTSDELADVVAQAVRIHAIDAAPAEVPDAWAITNLTALADRLASVLDAEQRGHVDAARAALAPVDRCSLPAALIHADLTAGNILVPDPGAEGGVVVLDFAVANRLPRVQELAVVAAGLCHGAPDPLPHRAETVGRLYSAASEATGAAPLTGAERDALHAFTRAAAAMELLGALAEWYQGERGPETAYLIDVGLAGLRDYRTAGHTIAGTGRQVH